ncbi:MBL fold metallo-hydrolase [Paenibacillus sp. MMS20-IR301]|uniref:MBL fold metallo-hydrolase n=1 Tax=Paenibacillus sp. MMS20-IR301 TaxID=2895946 RepID=UPI0028E22BEA|nr:MBL fold metallo-hydrolase [Paenibacillus sp. MMS20-IR301]WNS45098.1 MBL fold metallo-hydrolase [Paenibacillus sp. MMS20-IR301]
MRVTQEGYLHQLTWLPRLFPVNCYLIEEEQELTLIDAGMPFSTQGILRESARLNKPLSRIVLTHAHADHVGALDKLKQLLPEAKVYISERDAALLAGDRSLRDGEPQLPIKGSVPAKVVTRPDILLYDGDTVGSLRAISTPGHTPGSMSFQDQRSGALIAGDAFQTFRGMAVAGKKVASFPFPAMATWSFGQALASAHKLIALAPSVLAAGHGDLVKNPVEIMKQAAAEAAKALGHH